MKINIIGKRKYVRGENNATIVYFEYPSREVEGVAVDSAFIPADMLSFDKVQVGKSYSIDYDKRGFLVALSLYN